MFKNKEKAKKEKKKHEEMAEMITGKESRKALEKHTF